MSSRNYLKIIKYSKGIILWLIIPASLLVFWILSTVFLTSNYSFTVIADGFNKNIFKNQEVKPILKGKNAVAEFKAKEDNLGIVAIRFHTFKRINNDRVRFRIKEKNQDNWYYQNEYKTDQFQWDQLFTFGFPIISDSKNKRYVIEIESLMGSKDDAVAVSKYEPVLVAQYQYPKEKLSSNLFELAIFLNLKIQYSFTDINVLSSSIIYLLPLLFYLIILRFYKKIYNPPNYNIIYLFLLSIFLYIFIMNQNNIYVEILIILYWVFIVNIYKLISKISFFLALLLLVFSILFILLGYENLADRASIWVYYFLLIGAFFALTEIKNNGKKFVDLEEFLSKLFMVKSNSFSK